MPVAPNAGGSAFQCDAPAFAAGAIDTGFSVRLRDSGYSTGGALCGNGYDKPTCVQGGLEVTATCADGALPSGDGNVVACAD